LLVRWLRSEPPRTRWCAAGGYLALEVLVSAVAASGGSRWQQYVFVLPAVRGAEFVLGVVLALEVGRGWRLHPVWAAALVAASLVVAHVAPAPRPVGDLYLLPAWFAVIAAAAGRDLEAPAGLLTSKVLHYAGRVSFCFYLVHEMTIELVQRWCGAGWSYVPLCALAATAVAVVLHHTVELPAQRRLRALRRPEVASPAADR
jgi:peptidoglycan/LPS O-acetylase OafA/YrhL